MGLLHHVCALGLVAVTFVACHPLSEGDAQGALRVAEDAAKTADAGKRMRVLYAGCGVLASCAAGCSSALEDTVDDSQRARLLARCFKDLEKAKAADPKITADLWFQGYFDGYLVRAREKLPAADQARLDTVRKKLGSSK
jgi:hypothetical protein